MTPIPRYRPFKGPALFTAGFRPFFLGGAVWAALAVPLWLMLYHGVVLPTALAPIVWHAHEMIYGYGGAIVAGFLLTAIPNWTGRMPLQGAPLILLFATWAAGRLAILVSGEIGAASAAIIDLAFPLAFTFVVAREIIAGRSWHNMAVLLGLLALAAANLLVHAESLELTQTAYLGNRLGIAILLTLISLIGGRIVPSFTTNWIKKNKPDSPLPAPRDMLDIVAMIVVAGGVMVWAFRPEGMLTSVVALAAGLATAFRLSRWRFFATLHEPLLAVLHVGYGWLALGLILVGANGFYPVLPSTTALHALTVGAIGTMTLAVMTRATLGHTGQGLEVGWGTTAIYLLISVAAILRTLAPLAGQDSLVVVELAGAGWSAAFLAFAALYGPLLLRPRIRA